MDSPESDAGARGCGEPARPQPRGRPNLHAAPRARPSMRPPHRATLGQKWLRTGRIRSAGLAHPLPFSRTERQAFRSCCGWSWHTLSRTQVISSGLLRDCLGTSTAKTSDGALVVHAERLMRICARIPSRTVLENSQAHAPTADPSSNHRVKRPECQIIIMRIWLQGISETATFLSESLH